jgi:hypothetical protein
VFETACNASSCRCCLDDPFHFPLVARSVSGVFFSPSLNALANNPSSSLSILFPIRLSRANVTPCVLSHVPCPRCSLCLLASPLPNASRPHCGSIKHSVESPENWKSGNISTGVSLIEPALALQDPPLCLSRTARQPKSAMSLKPSPAKPKRLPFGDDSDSDGEISSDEMPELMLPESDRADVKIDKDGYAIYEAEEAR